MITRVSVRNFKSLTSVDVDLGPLTILVGQNGAGKSNLVDALRFVSDCVGGGLERAVADRGGIASILPPTPKGRRPDLTITLEFKIADKVGEYSFTLSGRTKGDIEIKRERCLLDGNGYEVEGGTAKTIPYDASVGELSIGTRNLFPSSLLAMGYRDTATWEIATFLRNASYYTLFPDRLRSPQKLFSNMKLMADGFNLSSVLRDLRSENPSSFDSILKGLSKAVPDVNDIDISMAGSFLVVSLKHQRGDQTDVFDLSQESDGTLRLLGILTALYQKPSPTLITLEEPELTVHPGALRALYESIKEASASSQIVLTTHSPDLISFCDPIELRVVDKAAGETKVDLLDERQIEIISDKLFSTGDLLRIEGLQPRSSN